MPIPRWSRLTNCLAPGAAPVGHAVSRRGPIGRAERSENVARIDALPVMVTELVTLLYVAFPSTVTTTVGFPLQNPARRLWVPNVPVIVNVP